MNSVTEESPYLSDKKKSWKDNLNDPNLGSRVSVGLLMIVLAHHSIVYVDISAVFTYIRRFCSWDSMSSPVGLVKMIILFIFISTFIKLKYYEVSDLLMLPAFIIPDSVSVITISDISWYFIQLISFIMDPDSVLYRNDFHQYMISEDHYWTSPSSVSRTLNRWFYVKNFLDTDHQMRVVSPYPCRISKLSSTDRPSTRRSNTRNIFVVDKKDLLEGLLIFNFESQWVVDVLMSFRSDDLNSSCWMYRSRVSVLRSIHYLVFLRLQVHQ